MTNFWLFCLYYDYEFFSKRVFLKEVALAFQKVIDEYINGVAISVSVSMPPRAGKSYIASLFSTYWLGRFPELSVMRNSCTATLYQKFSYDTRNIIRSKRYTDIFTGVQLASDKQNLDGWNLSTSKQVGYFGAGVGGTIIGFGANIAISDDLYKSMQDALSTTTNAFVKMWKQSAHDSRKEKNCPEIFIGTRWKDDDIIGEALTSNKIDIEIKISALIDEKSFCEDVKSTDEYLKIKGDVSKIVWDAEYMQEPSSPEGILIPESKLTFADLSKSEVLYRFAVGDPADTGGDKFSCPFINVVSIQGNIRAFVNTVVHTTDGVRSATVRVGQKLRENKTECIFYEKNGLGLAAIELQINDKPSECNVIPFNSTEQKEVSILSFYEFIPKFFIFNENYKDDKEYSLFIKDLTSYTKEGDNKHKKDAIDVMSKAAKILKLKYKL